MFPGDWWNPGTGETAFFWHQVPAKQLMLRHKRHEPICKPYSEQYTMTIMSWFLIQKHWKILESFECSTSLKFADLFEMPKLLWRLPWRLSSPLGSLMTSRSSRMPDEAKRGTLRLENQKTTGLKKKGQRVNMQKVEVFWEVCFVFMIIFQDCTPNKWYQMIMSTWPSKPRHLGFDDEAEGFCSGAAGAAVVSGGAVSSCSPCQTAQPQYRSLMKFVGTVNPFRMQLYLFSM